MRNQNKLMAKIDQLQYSKMYEEAKALLAAIMRRGRCPKCGSVVQRDGGALVCSDPECDGVKVAQDKVKLYAVAKNIG